MRPTTFRACFDIASFSIEGSRVTVAHNGRNHPGWSRLHIKLEGWVSARREEIKFEG